MSKTIKIAIASGKGGTGKSTVATSFSYLLSKSYDDVYLLDCDVEEPNCHIFLKPKFESSTIINMPIPEIDEAKCIKCGKCAEVCQYNALAFVKGKVLKFSELCHGCGSCDLACPAGAIKDAAREVGVLQEGSGVGLKFIHGKLRIGEAMSPPLIKAVKKVAKEKSPKIQILDCPPGTSCPAIAAVDGADYVFMVTEPTPFGLYDLKLGVDVIKKMGLNFGIIINRSCDNDYLIENYAVSENINILAKIPYAREAAHCYSKGEIIAESIPSLQECFEPLIDIVREGLE